MLLCPYRAFTTLLRFYAIGTLQHLPDQFKVATSIEINWVLLLSAISSSVMFVGCGLSQGVNNANELELR